jgi:hypothetical protein
VFTQKTQNEILFTLEKKKLQYATIWMKLEDITLSEKSRSQTDTAVATYKRYLHSSNHRMKVWNGGRNFQDSKLKKL